MDGLAALDWVVIAAYGAVVLGIGWWANRRQRSAEDYFLGGRKLAWWAVGVSLIATSFSSVSLIGGTGFGFSTGMKWLQLQLGDLLAIAAVCVIFLPFFSGLRITTAYEYLERRFGPHARRVASALFIAQTLLRTAVLVFAPALALATILGWSVELAIVVTAAAATLYSAFGGISAVVWTDCIQLAVVLFAVGYCVVLVAGDVPGGLPRVLEHASESGRLETVTFSARPDELFNVVGATVPYAVLAFALFGTGQQAVQRFLSCADVHAARRAAVTGWAVGTLALGTTLFLGVCLAAWVDLASGGDALAGIEKADSVLPVFITARLPAGVAGLMLAAIFAASMSSIDSAIHSMSTATIVDFLRAARRRTDVHRELRTARLGTALFGVAAVVGALYAAESDTQILDTLVRWLGYVAGPLLGVFLLGVFSERVQERGALMGLAAAVAVVVCVVNFVDPGARPWLPFGFHPLWIAPFSCCVTLVVGWVSGFTGPAPDDSRLDGLTWRRRAARAGGASHADARDDLVRETR